MGQPLYIADKIKRLTDNVGGIEDDPGPYDQQILAEIEKQMIAYGYTKVDSVQCSPMFLSL
ncbi:MAG: hypothetical protein MZV64_69050 [Ignavibacteriales bacterium]|nr:hypothetical protein [Ignavibacteriales bacterium]